MVRPKIKYMEELAEGLGNHQDKNNILREYEAHIDEILLEAEYTSDEELTRQILTRLGSPEEILAVWQEELSVTPSSMKWLFFMFNIFLFMAGTLLTLSHNLFQWPWLNYIWKQLTSIPTLIAFLYLFFWALLGYEIGKGFGHGGKVLLNKTFILSMIPNLLLMILTVFEIIPYTWFEPLLTKSFIFACIIFTIVLYPVSWLGFRWGRKASI
ncbi:hypothetical protein HPT25_17935 [Bacillus sp. BRMEA1]|uniref:HAAS signaling domain-containing protein n=1 Tax=Neobacillus endophyticus TaxID=2738405 RepID=UPI00156555B3|nr:hypothetical protein [Neobacillus endophyticus]NRD79242.1 hypothetical protein [Neobacillus endophyticus]